MHDHFGLPLKEGDRVMVPAIVKSVSATPDYCNLSVETLYGRKPDGIKETFTFNANVVLRANTCDEVKTDVFVKGE